MSLVKNIKSLCDLKNIRLEHFSKEMGWGENSIYRWDKNSPSIEKLQKVAEYFKVTNDFLIYGYHYDLIIDITSEINSIRHGRSYEQFAEDTGIDIEEINNLCNGYIYELIPIETLEKIAASNPIPDRIDRIELLRIAGYDARKIPIPKWANIPPIHTSSSLSPKEERDIARDLEKILANLENDNGMSFYDGEPMDGMDEEDKELLRISLLTSMQIAKQMAKKKFTPKKYRKE